MAVRSLTIFATALALCGALALFYTATVPQETQADVERRSAPPFQQPRPIEPQDVSPPSPPVFDQQVVAQGKVLYAEHCAVCHGDNLEGAPNWRERNSDGSLPPPPHDETGHTWHHADDMLFAYTKLGGAALIGDLPGFVSAMPGFEGVLNDAEIEAVLVYIKSTWPPELQAMQARMSAMED